MIEMLATTIIVSALVPPPLVGTGDGMSGAAMRDALTELLQAVERNHETIQTEFIVAMYSPVPVERLDQLGEEDHLSQRRVLWSSAPHRLRVESFYSDRENEDEIGDLDAPTVIEIWTGDQWIMHVPSEGMRDVRPAFQPRAHSDCWALFNRVAWPSMLGRTSMSEAVANMPLLSAERSGDAVRFLFQLNDLADVELLVDMNDGRIFEGTVRMYDGASHDQDREITIEARWTVAEWAEYGDLVLPARSYRDIFMAGSDDKPATVGRTVFTRQSAQDRFADPPNDKLFKPESLPGE